MLLQRGTPETILLRAVLAGGHALEKSLHKKFRGDRMRGEWFLPSPAIMELIDTAPPVPDEVGAHVVKRHSGVKMDPHSAREIWLDLSRTADEAVLLMPGWSRFQAYKQLGPRGADGWLTPEKARAMSLKARATRDPSAPDRWKTPEYSSRLKALRTHWLSREFSSGVEAYNALPDDIRRDVGSIRMLYKICGPRGGHGGRPPKVKHKGK